jgi:hypothetical protein
MASEISFAPGKPRTTWTLSFRTSRAISAKVTLAEPVRLAPSGRAGPGLRRSSTLFAGASNALYTVTSKHHYRFRHHPFFATLSAMLGLGCLGVGGTMLFETFVLLQTTMKTGGVMPFALASGFLSHQSKYFW